MRYMLLTCFIFLCLFTIISTHQLPKDHDEHIQEMAKAGYALIDALFDHARESVELKKDLMDAQWLSKQKEIKEELQNLLSDSTILLTFDENTENPIPRMLSNHVEQKIKKEIPRIFDIYEISIKRVEDFYEFSHTMCKLCGGSRCGRLIRDIQSDNFDKMAKLKLQKMSRKQLRKETAQQLRDAFLYGGHK